jgi:hypothetical protein
MFKCCFSTSAEEPKKLPSGPISVAVKVAEKPVMLKFRMSPQQEQDDASRLAEESQIKEKEKEKAVFSVLPATPVTPPPAVEKKDENTKGRIIQAFFLIGALYTYFYYTVASRV